MARRLRAQNLPELRASRSTFSENRTELIRRGLNPTSLNDYGTDKSRALPPELSRVKTKAASFR
jgi:hypothetical protein